MTGSGLDRSRAVMDLSRLPTYAFGSRSPMWWGTLGFILIESAAFLLAISAYFYLAAGVPDWPIGAPPPDLLAGTLLTIVLVLSAIPNHFVERWARAEDMWKVRMGLVIMSILGVVPLVLRGFEFASLNILWNVNAYGSILWGLLGLHTLHLLTDVVDTLVLTALMFTRHGYSGKRFSDVSDNAFYWDFVIISWLPIYALIYWVPRL